MPGSKLIDAVPHGMRFYLRAPKIAAIVSERPEMMQRRLREGVEFFHFLRDRRRVAH